MRKNKAFHCILKFSLQLEANNEQLECMARDLEIEKAKTDNLLSEMLPASVAHQLKSGLSVDARESKQRLDIYALVFIVGLRGKANNVLTN